MTIVLLIALIASLVYTATLARIAIKYRSVSRQAMKTIADLLDALEQSITENGTLQRKLEQAEAARRDQVIVGPMKQVQ